MAKPWKTDKTHISVRCPTGPRWRGGRLWNKDAIVMAKAGIDEDDATRILSDQGLLVEEIDDPNPAPKKGAAATA